MEIYISKYVFIWSMPHNIHFTLDLHASIFFGSGANLYGKSEAIYFNFYKIHNFQA